jgi:two-component system, NtrC family, sensor kinase
MTLIKVWGGYLNHYFVPILIILLIIPLGFIGGIFFIAGSLLVAAFSFIKARQLITSIDQDEKNKDLLEDKLLHSQKLAAIGELSAGIAHEINNPIAIIRQEAEWMQVILKNDHLKEIKELEDLRDSSQEIVRQVDRCKEITHNLLNFARQSKPVLQLVKVNRVIEDMTLLVEREAKQKNIILDRQYLADLPPISSDAPLLRQVFLNLLSNATQAIGHNGRITITTQRSGNQAIEVKITDTGSGIAVENLNKIFDPFFTTKPQGQGTGLGLSISHGIIQKLGGHIAVTSELNKGTTFTITLPCQQK